MKPKTKLRRRSELANNLWRHRGLVPFVIPGLILVIMFEYIPMYGQILAFKRFDFRLGITDSPWVGLDNFKFLFQNSTIAWRMIRNTVGYYFLFTAVGLVCNITLAIALYECVSRRFVKVSQTIMIMPTFISYIAVAMILRGLIGGNGLITNLIEFVTGENIMFYTQAKYWPLILTLVNVWKGTGYGSILYLAYLTGMDQELFEAAAIDGATKWQRIKYITIPLLSNIVAIRLLMGLGGIMNSNTGLFYQVTGNIGLLYSTTQTIDAYVLNAMMNSSNFGATAAVTLFQNAIGTFMLIVVNLVVKKISPEHSIF